MVLDEVQRVPDLLLAVKRAVDRERQPGRYILTGFANLLLMKSVSESLAGRAAYLSLWPMTRRERLGQGRAGLSSELLGHSCEHWPEILNATDPEPADWRETVRDGGYPVPAVEYSDLVPLPAYPVQRTKRLIKMPRAYWSDTGLAIRLAGATEPTGAHLVNLILSDLLAWRDGSLLL